MDSNQPPLGVIVATAIIAVILQLVIAPAITFFGIVPNFVMVAIIITAMRNTPLRSTVTGFTLGLIFDLCSLGPTGAMALVFTILAWAISSLNKGVFTGSLAIDLIIMVAAIVMGEFLTSVIYAVMGVNPSFFSSLIQVVLPAVVYDTIIGFIFLTIYNAILGGGSSSNTRVGTGRSLTRKIKL